MFQATQFWLVHQITGSPLSLGLVGLANAVPTIVFSPYGGVFADRFDNRRLILSTQIALAALIFLLAILTHLDVVRMWHILTIAFVSGAVNAFDQPARQTLYPHLIDRKVMTSAVALNSSVWQGTRIIAPAAAGVMIATVGTAASFYLAGAGYLIMAVVMLGLKVPRIESGATGSTTQEIVAGFRFVTGNSLFLFLIGMTFFNSFFGMTYLVLMPVFAADVLERGSEAYGMLLSASGIGSLATTIWIGSLGDFRRKGLMLIGGAVLFGLSLVAFALTSELVGSYLLALALMFTVGVFNSTYMVTIMSALQMMVPDRMRGRVMSIYGMTWSILPLGALQAGAIANFIGAPLALAIGGLAVTLFALSPAMVNNRIRNLSVTLLPSVSTTAPEEHEHKSVPSGSDD